MQSLWDFALSYYAQPGIADACVQVQDDYKANVCLLISLRWLDSRGHHLSASQLSELKTYIQPWYTQVVVPLRLLRRQLKEPVGSFLQNQDQEQTRSGIKQAELLAEKKLLLEIDAWLNNHQIADKKNAGDNTGIQVRSNLGIYLENLSVPENLIAVLACDTYF